MENEYIIRGSSSIIMNGNMSGTSANSSFTLTANGDEKPEIVFKKIKKGMKLLETHKYSKQIKKLEIYYNQLIQDGQLRFSEKTGEEIIKKLKEIDAYSKGIKFFIDGDILTEIASRILNGKSLKLTMFQDYCRVVPKSVLEKKKKFDNIFDQFQILHTDDEELVIPEKVEESVERQRREKDPILFGRLNESERLYFIDDWEDEYCDFTFDDLVDEMELSDSDVVLKNNIM